MYVNNNPDALQCRFGAHVSCCSCATPLCPERARYKHRQNAHASTTMYINEYRNDEFVYMRGLQTHHAFGKSMAEATLLTGCCIGAGVPMPGGSDLQNKNIKAHAPHACLAQVQANVESCSTTA
jgi:hypothetical protein